LKVFLKDFLKFYHFNNLIQQSIYTSFAILNLKRRIISNPKMESSLPNQLFDTSLCTKCRGKGFCKKPCKIYSKLNLNFKRKLHFSGASPPEIFVGRFNYPNINAGILSPELHKATEEMSMPEIWHKKDFSIQEVLSRRSQLIYGRFETQIKQPRTDSPVKNKFLNLMQEISMAYKSVSTEFFLKKIPKQNLEMNKFTPIIANPAPLKHARLQENPKVKPKVDYIISDTDVKSIQSIKELYKNKIPVSNIMKILSAGLLGLKTQRRLVPTRWSITATDDTISKEILKRVKYYPEILDILLFHEYYNGNHYEILLLPDKFAFEVIEAYFSGSLWNPDSKEVKFSKDHEFFQGRKKYAFEVTGAYYTARLALVEYLEKIKRQATAIFFREERPEYYAPLGVGILRETTRFAFTKKPEKFNTIQEALNQAQTRLKLPITLFKEQSVVLKEYGKQTRLNKWF
jgi:DNA repair protein NreA